MKKSSDSHTFESTQPLEIDEELYVTDFTTNEALKPNLLGSWSIKIEGVTQKITLEETQSLINSEASIAVPAGISPPRGVKNSQEIQLIISQQKKDGYPYPDQMNNTVWISNI